MKLKISPSRSRRKRCKYTPKCGLRNNFNKPRVCRFSNVPCKTTKDFHSGFHSTADNDGLLAANQKGVQLKAAQSPAEFR